ncbi:MAG: thiamine phosphate synthase [Alicyclobacillaceae bacterium]|nr:thiamine phosphate synthase [Alicyclobacillaceae bacterium]
MTDHGRLISSRSLADRLRVYVVTDGREDETSLLDAVASALEGGATTVQLRQKNADGGRLVAIGREIRKITARFGALYVVNDRLDVALLTEADGLHVGQTDISCRDARSLMPHGILGVSVGTVEEALAAIRDGADYLGVGAIFPTATKQDADLCGLDGLAAIRAAVTAGTAGSKSRERTALVAIGGITVDNAIQVRAAGADGVAVVSAVMGARSAADAARRLIEMMQESIGVGSLSSGNTQ